MIYPAAHTPPIYPYDPSAINWAGLAFVASAIVFVFIVFLVERWDYSKKGETWFSKLLFRMVLYRAASNHTRRHSPMSKRW